MAQPPAPVRAVMQRTLAYWQLDRRLGDSLFPPANWHQTLSDRFFEGRSLLGPLRRAGGRIQAQACTLLLNRIRGIDRRQADGRGAIHWSFLPRGEPDGFAALLAAVRASLAQEGLASPSGHTPHLTISYDAPSVLGTQKITPIPWTIDEILLVEGHGVPYAYEVIERWPLRAAAPAQQQLDLL